MEQFFQPRKHLPYYRRVRSILRGIIADSHLDVGCWDTPVVKWSHASQKYGINLEEIDEQHRHRGVHYMTGDFMTKNIGRFDIVTCLQVVEHQSNERVYHFVQKLFDSGRIVIISIPWEWPEDACIHHPQDPIGYEKLKSWTERDPDALYIDETKRAVAVYGFTPPLS